MMVGRRRFEQMVADALDSIPAALGEQMDNVVVVVEDWPSADQLDGADDTLLGLYDGVPLTSRDPVSYDFALPDVITIFRGPLAREARDEAELAEQVRITVLHEVGHYFGIDDDRLHELGWA